MLKYVLREINKFTIDQHTDEDRPALHDEQDAGFHTLKYSRKKGARAYARRPLQQDPLQRAGYVLSTVRQG
jgi:hypothetical protein